MVNTDSAAVYVKYETKQHALVFRNNPAGDEIEYLLISDEGQLSEKTVRVASKDPEDTDGDVFDAFGKALAATVMSDGRVRVYTFNDKMEIIELCLNGDIDAKVGGQSNKWFVGSLSTNSIEWNTKEINDKSKPPPKGPTKAIAAPNSSITALSELNYTAVGANKTPLTAYLKVYFNPAHNPNIVACATYNGKGWSAKELRK